MGFFCSAAEFIHPSSAPSFGEFHRLLPTCLSGDRNHSSTAPPAATSSQPGRIILSTSSIIHTPHPGQHVKYRYDGDCLTCDPTTVRHPQHIVDQLANKCVQTGNRPARISSSRHCTLEPHHLTLAFWRFRTWTLAGICQRICSSQGMSLLVCSLVPL